jgi:predicted Fe-Mo cluster-binding NifX family protein
MKIAVATDDKKTIAKHFGGGTCILVVTVEDGKIVNSEERQKPGHGTLPVMEVHPQTDLKARDGFGPESDERPSTMFEIFKDCEVLLVDMIGTDAYSYFLDFGVRVTATDVRDIEEAIRLYIASNVARGEGHVD